jgi:hypothetical protein
MSPQIPITVSHVTHKTLESWVPASPPYQAKAATVRFLDASDAQPGAIAPSSPQNPKDWQNERSERLENEATCDRLRRNILLAMDQGVHGCNQGQVMSW